MASTSAAPLRLQSRITHCELRPDLGGCIASLTWGGVHLLRQPSEQPLLAGSESGSYPLVPFSNRIGYARARWQDQPLALARNFSPEPHMIHGIGWQRAWQVEHHTDTEAVLTLAHAGDADWPFAFSSKQRIELDEHSLALEMEVANLHHSAAPVGLGWHPYFEKRHGMRVQFACEGRWEMDADNLPTTLTPLSGMVADVSHLLVDHCFDGWHGDVLLEDEHIRLRLHSNLNRLVVYTTPERSNIAIEPVSHVNNAINLAPQLGRSVESLGLVTLQPGERLHANMRLEWSHKS